ncbi:glycosyltransferase family 2 protein [Williamsia soli]|uniref:glycosyltransferase family 2 protein n=1 Tax=Williamsia soli TaxID=364929 RepID=UPI001A9CECB9|nr:hypothetical protein [Williamsia soli]
MGNELADGGRPHKLDDSEGVIVCVITYGHSEQEVRQALASAKSLSDRGLALKLYVIDDSSGRAPRVEFATTLTTHANEGYSAALNFILKDVVQSEKRLVMINPDVVIDEASLRALCWPPQSAAPILVPKIVDADRLENVREIYTTRNALMQLTYGSLSKQKQMLAQLGSGTFPLGKPWVPAGTVLSLDPRLLDGIVLDPEMFWIEMSALARDLASDTQFEVLAVSAQHLGNSSKKIASATVEASLLNARCAYVRKYGSVWERRLIPFVVAIGLVVKIAARRTTPIQAGRMWLVSRGALNWNKVSK